MFPSNGSMTRHPLPSRGSPWGEFAAFIGTMGCSDVPTPFPPHFVILRLAVPARVPVFVSPLRPGTGREAWSLVVWQLRASGCGRETWGPPKFLGNPVVPMPCSSTPAGPIASGLFDASAWPPLLTTTKAPTTTIAFGAQSHGLGTRCLRFVRPVTRTGRQTRFPLLAGLYGTGLATRWVPTKGFQNAPTSFPPLPSFAWRNVSSILPGRPGSCLPGLPQIRTCPIKASGSSRHGLTIRLATRRRVDLHDRSSMPP